ncbi:PAS domain S-box protein [Sorangium sp. So ce1128]
MGIHAIQAGCERAEHQLRREQERFAFTLDAAEIVAWDWDPHTDEVILSANAERILGIPSGRTIDTGKHLSALVHSDDRERIEQALQRAAGEGTTFDVEYRLVRPSGGELWVNHKGRAALTVAGTPGRAHGMLRDITRSKQTEEHIRELNAALRQRAEQLQAILNVLPVGIFVADDPACTSIRPNHAGARMLGISIETDISKSGPAAERMPLRFLRDGTEIPADELPMQRAARTGETVWGDEVDVIRGDGTSIRLLLYAVPLLDEEAQLRGCIGTGIDITERRRAEQALRESEERFQTFMAHSPAAAWIVDQQGQILYVSPTYLRMFRSGTSDPVGKSIFDLYPEQLAQKYMETSLRAVREGRVVEEVEPAPRRDGTDGYFLVYRFPIRNAADHVSIGGVAIDITELKQAEKQLKEIDRRKDEFLATLAHELRNPLAPMRNALQILHIAEPSNPRAQSARKVMDRQVQQLARLVDDLLDVARITRGKLELRKERVDVASIVERALETSRPVIAHAQHRLSVHLPQERSYLVADPMRVAQVLSNLLNNAAKYTPCGGDIQIVTERLAGEVIIKVQDNGTGISPEMLPRIFEMFTQADTTLERAQGGLGIGLTIVKQLVELHGGRIMAESDGLGRGSSFSVALPLALEERCPAEEHVHGDDPQPTSHERRILVVDDNQDAADTLATLLDAMGNDVRTAYDGWQALRVAEEHRPDIIFLDIGMPGINGYEVAHRLRAQPETRDVMLVAMTGWGQEADRKRSKEAGFDHHWIKPIDPQALDDLLSCSATRRSESPLAAAGRLAIRGQASG